MWMVAANLLANSQPKSVGLVWGLAATRRSVSIHRMNWVNWCNGSEPWWQHHKYRHGDYYYYVKLLPPQLSPSSLSSYLVNSIITYRPEAHLLQKNIFAYHDDYYYYYYNNNHFTALWTLSRTTTELVLGYPQKQSLYFQFLPLMRHNANGTYFRFYSTNAAFMIEFAFEQIWNLNQNSHSSTANYQQLHRLIYNKWFMFINFFYLYFMSHSTHSMSLWRRWYQLHHIIIHVSSSRTVGRVMSGVRDLVCMFVCPFSNKENGLSYPHQTWYTYTL